MITVIIPAFNEEKTIGNCLDSLVKQKTKKKFDVIVVDNNSTDKTNEVTKAFSKKIDLQIILEKKKGRGVARKTGFQHATGKILFSTDADTILPSHWIETLSTGLENGTSIAVTGTSRIIDSSTFNNVCFNFFQPLTMKVYRFLLGHYWLSGFSFAIYKKTYEQAGGFDPELNAQEDIELSFKVSKIGKIKFVGTVPVIISGRRFKNGLIKGLLSYATTFLKLFMFKQKKVVLSDPR